jgi:hypothetical protein
MLDTKRSRGQVVVLLGLAVLVVGSITQFASNRALDERVDDFMQAATERFDPSDPTEVRSLWEGTVLGEPGDTVELDRFLEVDGVEPEVVREASDGIEARYRVESWGGSDVVVVAWTDHGVFVTPD